MLISAPPLIRRLLLGSVAAALLTACASQPAPPPEESQTQEVSSAETVRSFAVAVAALTPDDPGITRLAHTVSSAEIVSFAGDWSGSLEDQALKSALTEALVRSGRLGLLVLDLPCEGAETLNSYASGGATSTLAADLVRTVAIPASQKTAALADILTVLRGWNAVNPEQQILVSSMQCELASSADQGRVAVFWGLSELPAHAGEKDLAAAALKYGEPSGNHIWLVQTTDAALSDILPASGWFDLRGFPGTEEVVTWRQDKAAAEPRLRPQHPSSADIIFRHSQRTAADPF